jgi:hypothetical protein
LHRCMLLALSLRWKEVLGKLTEEFLGIDEISYCRYTF